MCMNSEKVATVGCVEAENICGKNDASASSSFVRDDAVLPYVSSRIESSQMAAPTMLNEMHATDTWLDAKDAMLGHACIDATPVYDWLNRDINT